MEELLHYVWKHRIFPLNELTTTTGQRLEIIDTGLANRDAGPDFFNAKIKIEGVFNSFYQNINYVKIVFNIQNHAI